MAVTLTKNHINMKVESTRFEKFLEYDSNKLFRTIELIFVQSDWNSKIIAPNSLNTVLGWIKIFRIFSIRTWVLRTMYPKSTEVNSMNVRLKNINVLMKKVDIAQCLNVPFSSCESHCTYLNNKAGLRFLDSLLFSVLCKRRFCEEKLSWSNDLFGHSCETVCKGYSLINPLISKIEKYILCSQKVWMLPYSPVSMSVFYFTRGL